MRYRVILVSLLAFASIVSGCTKAVLGPDLAHRPTPFVTEGTVELSDTFGVMQATITARPGGDTATVRFEELGDKPYNATVTYHAFIPVIAETNAVRKDYWLVGLNLAQTPDRAFYAVMRYPHGKGLAPGTTRDDFEFRVLNCGPYHPKAKPAEEAEGPEAEVTENAPGADSPANQVPHAENDTQCVFDTIDEVEQHTNWILQKDDMFRRQALTEPDTEVENSWSRLTVKAR